MSAEKHFVESLVQQCHSYILMHMEEFPVSFLSLLPLSTRKELLTRMPVADVCLRLVDTRFVEGIDMEAYWKLPCKLGEVKESDIYVEEWGKTKYAKAVFYGRVANVVIGCLRHFSFYTPSPRCIARMLGTDNDERINAYGGRKFDMRVLRKEDNDLIRSLYGVRKFDGTECNFVIPPRYHDKSESFLSGEMIAAAVSCFNGELPKILRMDMVVFDMEFDDPGYVDFLRELRVLRVLVEVVEFAQVVLKKATQLEMLIIRGAMGVKHTAKYIAKSLNKFFTDLSSHPTFWSNFRALRLDAHSSESFTVSQKNFDQLITAYLSTPTDHAQKVRFSNSDIVAHDTCPSPKINDESYLHFKTIELDNCRFVSKCHTTPETVSHWLGRGINVLEDGLRLCSFKVSDNSSLARKCRYPEIESENGDQD